VTANATYPAAKTHAGGGGFSRSAAIDVIAALTIVTTLAIPPIQKNKRSLSSLNFAPSD